MNKIEEKYFHYCKCLKKTTEYDIEFRMQRMQYATVEHFFYLSTKSSLITTSRFMCQKMMGSHFIWQG